MPRHQDDLSPFALACRLPSLREAERRAEDAYVKLHSSIDPHGTAKTVWLARSDRVEALEQTILAAEPRTLSDVAAIMLMAANEVGIGVDCVRHEQGLSRAKRALQRCLFVVAGAAGISLADIAFADYAPDAERTAGDGA